MTSMAAALAASLPAAISRQATPQPAAQQPSKVPQRLEGVVDVEAAREVENVSLSSLVSRLDHARLSCQLVGKSSKIKSQGRVLKSC